MDAAGRGGPDSTLVLAARDGDQRALNALVAESLPLVYNIVGRALGGHADVDDVVQETLLRVVRHLPDLRDPTAFRSWLVAIAVRQVRDREEQRRAAWRAQYRASTTTGTSRPGLRLRRGDHPAARPDRPAPGGRRGDPLAGPGRPGAAGAVVAGGGRRRSAAPNWPTRPGAVPPARGRQGPADEGADETARAVVRALRAQPRCPELAPRYAAGTARRARCGASGSPGTSATARLCDRRTAGCCRWTGCSAGAALLPVPASLTARVTGPARPGRRAPRHPGRRPPGRSRPDGRRSHRQRRFLGRQRDGCPWRRGQGGAGGLLTGWTGAVGVATVVAAVIATVVVVFTGGQPAPQAANAGAPSPVRSAVASAVLSPSAVRFAVSRRSARRRPAPAGRRRRRQRRPPRPARPARA